MELPDWSMLDERIGNAGSAFSVDADPESDLVCKAIRSFKKEAYKLLANRNADPLLCID
jgi:hypothetical protein